MPGRPKFKIGDKVKVRLNSTSPFKGRVGVIKRGPLKEPAEAGYMLDSYIVEFGLKEPKQVNYFIEQDLERLSG